jgi:23S rRNA (guanine745-N1)-methyltransferase
VSSLQPRPGHALLRCPLCKSGFTAAVGALVCRNGHSFDLAREGYVNLLPSRRRRPAAGGDGPAQLRHRAEFLDAGHLDAVATMVAAHVEQSAVERILDAGSGTGYHLAGIAAKLPGTIIGLGLDISKDAARQAARRWPTPAFAVADLWAEWPVHDAAVDLVLSIFAPKNFHEIARVLRPGGWLALTHPGPEHLIELRNRFGLLRQNEKSSRRYADMTAHFIGPPPVVRLHSRAVLDPATVLATILMGPNARHVDRTILDVSSEPIAVTFDINLLFAQKSRDNLTRSSSGLS